MAKPSAELARTWLLKSFSDLDTARQISELPDGHLDTGIYHCQQAVKNALQRFLVLHGKPFEKIHDLGKIWEQVIVVNPALQRFADAAGTLTPCSVVYSNVRS